MRPHAAVPLEDLDRAIINATQGGIPIEEEPFKALAVELNCDEDEIIRRLDSMLRQGVLSRFGPMYHAERLGGGLTLAAMKVPTARFDEIAKTVNGFAEVAHNYARDHVYNMWFVVATEHPEQIGKVIASIEEQTGLRVYNMPKEEEFFVGLRLDA